MPAVGGTATAIGNRPTPVRRGVSPRALTRMGPPRRMSPAAISVWVALVFGTLSLALRFTPGYDPWTWALWGREIAHLDLSTVAGPAWKPLPVVLLALASPLGLGAPAVWLVVARAGWVLAVLTVWRLTYRTVRCVAGPFTAVTAAGIAGIGLVLSVGFTGFLLPLAMSEPLLTAAVLLAVDYHARGRHGAGFVSLTVAALLRPEVWPILLASGVVVVRMTPRHRLRRSLLVSGVGVAVLALWYVPDWLGSGDLMRSVERAAIPTQGGPLLTQNPALAVLRSAGQMLPLPWMLAGGVTVFAAVCCLFRYVPRKATSTRIVFLVTAVGLLWLGTQMLMTAAHRSSGEPRYLVVTTACAAVLAGVGVVLTPRLLAMCDRPRATTAAQPLAVGIHGSLGGTRRLRWGHGVVGLCDRRPVRAEVEERRSRCDAAHRRRSRRPQGSLARRRGGRGAPVRYPHYRPLPGTRDRVPARTASGRTGL